MANTALYRYNKRNKSKLIQSHVIVLFVASILGDNISVSDIHKFLVSNDKATHYNNIVEYVRQLVALGLLDKIKGRQYNRDKINITISGLNVLQEYENILRIERYDR